MVLLSNFVLSVLIMQIISLVTLAGILFSEIFEKDRKNKLDTFWFLILVVLWSVFLIISISGLIMGYLSELMSWIAIVSFMLMFILFVILIIKRFKFFNRPMVFSELILLGVIMMVVLIDRHSYDSSVVLLMLTMTFVSTFLGFFITVDFLIKTSKGYIKKTRNYNSKMFLRVIVVFIFVGIALSGVYFLANGPSNNFVAEDFSGELNIYNWENYFDENAGMLDVFEKELYRLVYFSEYVESEQIRDLKNEPWEELTG